MKNLAIVVFIFTLGYNNLSNAQAPPCAWSHNGQGPGYKSSRSIATDVLGNVYITGSFDSTSVTFGAITLNNAGGGSDMYVVKYSPSGSVLWANTAGSRGRDDYGTSVSVDSTGNVYVTGYFNSPSISFGTTTLTNSSGTAYFNDIFIVKYSSSGTMLWAKSAGGGFNDYVIGVSSDIDGNVFMTGYFTSPTFTFGTSILYNSITSVQGANIFLVKLSQSGNIIWANSIGGNQGEYAHGLCCDKFGNVFLTGTFWDNTLSVGGYNLTNSGGGKKDILIVKYSTTGTVLWAHSGGGSLDDYGLSVSADASGNVFMTGSYWSPTITIGTNTLTNASNSGWSTDIFTVKYSASGNLLWAKSVGGKNSDDGISVSTDANENVIVTGNFDSSTLVIGTNTLTNTNGVTWNKIFIMKYDPSGGVLWAVGSGIGIGDAGGISTDLGGNIFITGSYKNNLALQSCQLSYWSPNTIFIFKFADAPVSVGNNQITESEMNIYPNPFNSQTTISFSEHRTNILIRIFSTLGVEIALVPHFSGKQLLLEKGIMEAGVYFVQVIDEKSMVQIKRLVLQ